MLPSILKGACFQILKRQFTSSPSSRAFLYHTAMKINPSCLTPPQHLRRRIGSAKLLRFSQVQKAWIHERTHVETKKISFDSVCEDKKDNKKEKNEEKERCEEENTEEPELRSTNADLTIGEAMISCMLSALFCGICVTMYRKGERREAELQSLRDRVYMMEEYYVAARKREYNLTHAVYDLQYRVDPAEFDIDAADRQLEKEAQIIQFQKIALERRMK